MGGGKTTSRECNHKIQGNSKNAEADGLKKEERGMGESKEWKKDEQYMESMFHN